MGERNPLAILADIELDPKQGGLTEQLQLALGGHACEAVGERLKVRWGRRA